MCKKLLLKTVALAVQRKAQKSQNETAAHYSAMRWTGSAKLVIAHNGKRGNSS